MKVVNCRFSSDVIAAMLEPIEQKIFDDLFCLGLQHGRRIFCHSRLLGVSENQELTCLEVG